MICAPDAAAPVPLAAGAYRNVTIEPSRGTWLIIVTCNPTNVYRFTNQDPDFPAGAYIPDPGAGAR